MVKWSVKYTHTKVSLNAKIIKYTLSFPKHTNAWFFARLRWFYMGNPGISRRIFVEFRVCSRVFVAWMFALAFALICLADNSPYKWLSLPIPLYKMIGFIKCGNLSSYSSTYSGLFCRHKHITWICYKHINKFIFKCFNSLFVVISWLQ